MAQNGDDFLSNARIIGAEAKSMFEKFVQYLKNEGILNANQPDQELSLSQMKTIYNLNCKYNADFLTNSGSIVEFENLLEYAISDGKMVPKHGNIFAFPDAKITVKNYNRPNLDQKLDEISRKHNLKQAQWIKDKAVRVQLDHGKMGISAIRFPLGNLVFLTRA